MRLLGIDTATPATTVAVADGAHTLAERTVVDNRRHAELAGLLVRDVLSAAGLSASQVEAVAVGVGPGPYSGLRVGVATAVAFADALSIPVYGICTLDVLAVQAGEPTGGPGQLTVVTDARRREVFWANYDANGVRIAGPAVGRPADVAALATGLVVGPGALLYADVFGAGSGPEWPAAAALCAIAAARLAADGELLPAQPIYLRRPDATAPGPMKSVLRV